MNTASSTYFKCSCDHCSGRIEFPAEALGATVQCPHCHVQITLTSHERERVTSKRRVRKRVVLPIAFAVLGSICLLLVLTWPRALTVTAMRFEAATTSKPGAVSGAVSNRSKRAARDVRVEINLLNSHGETLWQATDYAEEIAPAASWNFRVLVLDPAVTTGKVARVTHR